MSTIKLYKIKASNFKSVSTKLCYLYAILVVRVGIPDLGDLFTGRKWYPIDGGTMVTIFFFSRNGDL